MQRCYAICSFCRVLGKEVTLVPYRRHGDQVAADLPSLAAALASEPEELLRDCAMRPCNATPFDSLRLSSI